MGLPRKIVAQRAVVSSGTRVFQECPNVRYTIMRKCPTITAAKRAQAREATELSVKPRHAVRNPFESSHLARINPIENDLIFLLQFFNFRTVAGSPQ